MNIAALVAWVVTALGGFVLLATWIRKGGVRQQQTGVTRLPAPVVFGHFLLAGAGLVVWIVYVVNDNDTLAWVAVALLALIALLGFAMLLRWIPVRQAIAAAGGEVPAETHFPLPIVLGHGVLAVTTVVLVLLAALNVGS